MKSVDGYDELHRADLVADGWSSAWRLCGGGARVWGRMDGEWMAWSNGDTFSQLED